jgi:hypothetical protein
METGHLKWPEISEIENLGDHFINITFIDGTFLE